MSLFIDPITIFFVYIIMEKNSKIVDRSYKIFLFDKIHNVCFITVRINNSKGLNYKYIIMNTTTNYFYS